MTSVVSQRIACFQILLGCGALASVWRWGEAANCNMRGSSTCICDMDDHSGFIDLTPISNGGSNPKPFFTGIKGNFEYSYNPCTGYEEGGCKNNNAVCQSSKASCGRQPGAKFDTTKNPPTLTYYNGDQPPFPQKRISTISLVCDEGTDHKMETKDDPVKSEYVFTLTSKYACVQKNPPPPVTTQPPITRPIQPTTTSGGHTKQKTDNPISLGTILDLCVFFVLLSYFTIGFAFMYVRRGARGSEAIPNREFWIALPGLVKEGCLLIVGKVRRRGSGYESL